MHHFLKKQIRCFGRFLTVKYINYLNICIFHIYSMFVRFLLQIFAFLLSAKSSSAPPQLLLAQNLSGLNKNVLRKVIRTSRKKANPDHYINISNPTILQDFIVPDEVCFINVNGMLEDFLID